MLFIKTFLIILWWWITLPKGIYNNCVPESEAKMKPLEKEIEDMLMAIGGQEALDVFKLLNGKKDVSEFVLADKLKLTINQIRTILYKFEKYNLITSIRKKDNTKGWYVYYFTFEEGKAFDAIRQYKVKELEKLKSVLSKKYKLNRNLSNIDLLSNIKNPDFKIILPVMSDFHE